MLRGRTADSEVEKAKISDEQPEQAKDAVPIEANDLEIQRDGDERHDDGKESADHVVRRVPGDAHANVL